MQDNESKEAVTSEPTTADIANVDKIREILFGNQIKTFENKFRQLEEKLSKELNDLKDDSTMRIDSLEKFIKSEFESLNHRLSGEKEARVKALDDNVEKFEKHIKSLSNSLSEQEQYNNDKARELRQLLLEQSKDLFEKMNKKQIEDRELLKSFRDELDSGKVDRSALSSLFTDIAFQISGNDYTVELLADNKKAIP